MPETPCRKPVVVLGGLDPTDQVLAGIGVQCALPAPVVVRHEMDYPNAALRRIVSDARGVLEDVWVPLDHLCMTCALTHEIGPTLARLAAAGRWESLVVCLPPTAPLATLTEALEGLGQQAGGPLAALTEVRCVVSAVRGADLAHDLMGDDLLCERGLAPEHDRRSVGEALAEQVEYADVVVSVDETLAPPARALLRELGRPGTHPVSDPSTLDHELLVARGRDARAARRFVDPARRRPAGRVADLAPDTVQDVTGDPDSGVWTLFLDTWKPFHPARLLANVEVLGGGPLRGRGCFWLPTRPADLQAWNGAGGQLSIGPVAGRGGRPRTRLVLTGTDDRRRLVATTLHETLATDAELAAGRAPWPRDEDGFEAWLGEQPRSA